MTINAVFRLIDMRTLLASFLPVLFGSVYALYAFESFHLPLMIAAAIGLGLIQSSTNMFNDHIDFIRGDDASSGREKPLATGELTERQVTWLTVSFTVLAFVIAIAIAAVTSWQILIVAVAGAVIAYLYTAGPKPISYTPFGEAASGLTMGLGITATVVFIHCNQFYWRSLLIAVPTVLYIAYIMFTNNFCDMEKDRNAGRKTFPLMIGYTASRTIWLLCIFLLSISTIVLVVFGFFPVYGLAGLLILANYPSVWYVKNLSEGEPNKGKLMELIGKIGVQYHVLMILAFLAAWFFS